MLINLRVSRSTNGHFAEVHSYQFHGEGDELTIRLQTEKGCLDLTPGDYRALCKTIDAFNAADSAR